MAAAGLIFLAVALAGASGFVFGWAWRGRDVQEMRRRIQRWKTHASKLEAHSRRQR